MISTAQRALINFVLRAIQAPPVSESEKFDLLPYRDALRKGGKPETEWKPIFASQKLQEKPRVSDWQTQTDSTHQAELDNLDKDLFPDITWLQRWVQTQPSLETNADFNRWTYSFKAALSQIPGQFMNVHTSLYHEFQLLSALVHASNSAAQPADSFTLVTGDFPGIQRTIYTITSSGATKGVRGRSFFLQLLAEAVVLSLLDKLNLPLTNVLYVAGGNFQILAPAGDDVQQKVAKIRQDITEQLLEIFGGDLALVITASPLGQEAFLTPKGKDAYQQHKDAERSLKSKPFFGIDPKTLFKEQGAGSQYYCHISHREPKTNEEIKEAEAEGDEWIAPEQRAFVDLARDLAKVQKYLDSDNVADGLVPCIAFSKGELGGKLAIDDLKKYDRLLEKITGYRMQVDIYQTVAKHETILRLGSAKYDLKQQHGYTLLAAHTPVMSQRDIQWWEENKPKRSLDEDSQLRVGESIRNFTMLAHQSRKSGFARYGVLRMDIDGLGAIFRDALETHPQRIVTSALLTRFFDGYLPRICAEYEAQQKRENSIYLIYGGGDDLFIVGEWDVLPGFAEYLRNLLVRYSHGTLTICAGIELFPANYPFYRAADDAENALSAAKARDGKDAITFLQETFAWKDATDWQDVKVQYERITRITESIDKRTAITNVARIYERWQEDVRQHGTAYINFGPFHWQAAYQIARITEMLRQSGKLSTTLQDDIKGIKQGLLSNIRPSGVAARWAELELRTKKEE